MAQTWEYQFESLDLSPTATLEEAARDLTALGEEGWEVVALLPNMGAGQSWTVALLKRPHVPGAVD